MNGYRLRTTDNTRARVVCTAQTGTTDVRLSGERELRFNADEETVASLSLALGAAGIGITTLAQESASLEELFLHLTEGDVERSAAEEVVAA